MSALTYFIILKRADFGQEGGEMFRYQKNDYIFVIWTLVSCEFEQKFEKFLDCISGLISLTLLKSKAPY
jgi:hypothetical protein